MTADRTSFSDSKIIFLVWKVFWNGQKENNNYKWGVDMCEVEWSFYEVFTGSSSPSTSTVPVQRRTPGNLRNFPWTRLAALPYLCQNHLCWRHIQGNTMNQSINHWVSDIITLRQLINIEAILPKNTINNKIRPLIKRNGQRNANNNDPLATRCPRNMGGPEGWLSDGRGWVGGAGWRPWSPESD